MLMRHLFQDNGYECSKKETKEQVVSIILSIAVMMVAEKFPTPAFFALTPFLLVWVFKPNQKYLMPLIILMLSMSQYRFFVCLGCFLYALMHLNQLMRYRIGLTFILYVTILPFFIWMTVQRFLCSYQGQFLEFGSSFSVLGSYLCFAGFFWGVLAFNDLPRFFFKALYWVSVFFFLSYFTWIFTGIGMVGNAAWKNFSCYVAVYPLVKYLFARKVTTAEWWAFVLCWSLYMIAFCFGLGRDNVHTSFTPLLLAFLGVCMGVVLRYAPSFLVLFSVIIIFPWISFHAWTAEDRVIAHRGDAGGSYEHLQDVRSFSEFYRRLKAKSIDDRATVWMLAVKGIKTQFAVDPIWVSPFREMQEEEIYDANLGRTRVVQSNLPAHNLFLQMLQDFGLWGGGGMLIIYIMIFAKKQTFWDVSRFVATDWGPVWIVCLVVGIFSAYSSATPIALQMTIILYALLGVCYRHGFDSKRGGF